MFAVIFSYAYAILLIAVIGEVDNPFLKWCCFLAGGWMAIAGSINGWRFARKL